MAEVREPLWRCEEIAKSFPGVRALDGVSLSIYPGRLTALTDRQRMGLLSGGNQQKIVLLLDEPTRGIEIHAKSELYALMSELASTGLAVVRVSSELSEMLSWSDRILVMCQGRVTGQFRRGQFHCRQFHRGQASEERLLRAALPKSTSQLESV